MKKLLSAILALATVISCSLFSNEDLTYESAITQWNYSKVTDYEFEYLLRYSSGNIKRIITVKEGSVFSILDLETGDLTKSQNAFGTIEDFFGLINVARNDGAEMIKGKYDPIYGYPKEVFIDYYVRAIDDESSFKLSNFKELQKPIQN